MQKQYGVDLWDMFDGWVGLPQFDPLMQFDNLDDAIAKCKEKQHTLDNANIGAGEHYGVIDLNARLEVFCAREVILFKQKGNSMNWISIAERLPEDDEEVEVATFHEVPISFSRKTMQWTEIDPLFKIPSIHRHPPSFTHWRSIGKEGEGK